MTESTNLWIPASAGWPGSALKIRDGDKEIHTKNKISRIVSLFEQPKKMLAIKVSRKQLNVVSQHFSARNMCLTSQQTVVTILKVRC